MTPRLTPSGPAPGLRYWQLNRLLIGWSAEVTWPNLAARTRTASPPRRVAPEQQTVVCCTPTSGGDLPSLRRKHLRHCLKRAQGSFEVSDRDGGGIEVTAANGIQEPVQSRRSLIQLRTRERVGHLRGRWSSCARHQSIAIMTSRASGDVADRVWKIDEIVAVLGDGAG